MVSMYLARSQYRSLLGGLAVVLALWSTPHVALAQEANRKHGELSSLEKVLSPEAGGLSLRTAVERAQEHAPMVELRRAELLRVKASQGQTFARYLPAVTLSASLRRSNQVSFDFGTQGVSVGAANPGALRVGACPDGSGNDCVLDSSGVPVQGVAPEPFGIPSVTYSLDAQVNVPLTDYLVSLPKAVTASRANQNSAELNIVAQKQQVALEATEVYYEWLRARAAVAIAAEGIESAQAALDDAIAGSRAGTLAEADVHQIEAALAAAQIAHRRAQSGEQVSREQLAILTGLSATDIRVGENILENETAQEELPSVEELGKHGQTKRAEVRALKSQAKALREGGIGKSAELFPRLDATASVTHANPNQQFFPPTDEWNTSWFVGLTASWSLDRFFLSRAQVKELQANESVAEAQAKEAMRGVRLEVAAAYRAQATALATLQLNQKQLMAAQSAFDQRSALFKAGEATSTELLEADLRRQNALWEHVSAKVDFRIANARLRHAAALDVEQAR